MQNLKDFFVVILFGSIFVYLLNNDSGLLSAIFDFIVSFSPLAWFIISVIVFAAFGYLLELLGLNEDQADFIGYLLWAPIICLAISFMYGFKPSGLFISLKLRNKSRKRQSANRMACRRC